MDELKVPPAVAADGNAVELIRCFVSQGRQITAINQHLYKDRDFREEKAWGIFLADTIAHLANAIGQRTNTDSYDISTDIVEALLAEVESPTSDIDGE